jgi:hypothetical protein
MKLKSFIAISSIFLLLGCGCESSSVPNNSVATKMPQVICNDENVHSQNIALIISSAFDKSGSAVFREESARKGIELYFEYIHFSNKEKVRWPNNEN